MRTMQIGAVAVVINFATFCDAQPRSCGPLATLAAPFNINTAFTPSGYMGDGRVKDKYVHMKPVPRPGDPGHLCQRISYVPGGSDGWAGVYWQFPADNWGDKPGQAIRNATAITFWAAGEKGGEIVEFKAGGNFDGACKDSFLASTGEIPLTTVWKPYKIDLQGKDLASVLDAFAWVARINANPTGLTFYVDAIQYERGGSRRSGSK